MLLPACGLVTLPAYDAGPADAEPAVADAGPTPILVDAARPDAAAPDAAEPDAAPPCRRVVDFTALGDLDSDAVESTGVLVYGTELRLRQGLGLGVSGVGPSEEYIDGVERIDVIFSKEGVSEVAYTVVAATDADGDSVRGHHQIDAYFSDGSTDSRTPDSEQQFELEALFPDRGNVNRLAITALSDGIRLSALSYSCIWRRYLPAGG